MSLETDGTYPSPTEANFEDAALEDIRSLLAELAKRRETSGAEVTIGRLRALLASLLEADTFKVGDIVVWRNGLKNRTYPDYGTPAIVVEVLSPPLIDTIDDSGSPYFREALNLRLGVIDERGDFLTFVYDGRRFEHYRDAGDRLKQLLDRRVNEAKDPSDGC